MIADIIPSCTLNSLAKFPSEITGKSYNCTEKVFCMENGQCHSCRRCSELTFDLLPHNSSCSHVGHKDEIGKVLNMDWFLTHYFMIFLIHGLAIISRVVDLSYLVHSFGYLIKIHKTILGILHTGFVHKYWTECGDSSVGNLVGISEEILKFEISLRNAIGKSLLFLCCINLILNF